ncbi:MAG: hypothetical protein LUQ13_01960 [Methanomicrobiales archaeon]|nr:hypothetical protein [Methanomicrobiales archaeon]
MTSRINARHTICPGCQEEVFLDELVGGRCPLCGCTLEEIEDSCEEFEEGLDRSDLAWLMYHYFIFKKFDSLGASPFQILKLLASFDEENEEDSRETASFSLEVPMQAVDFLRPKRCAKCRRIFIRGGKKFVNGDLRSPRMSVYYICKNC